MCVRKSTIIYFALLRVGVTPGTQSTAALVLISICALLCQPRSLRGLV